MFQKSGGMTRKRWRKNGFPLPRFEAERMFSQLQDEITYTNDTTLDMTVKTLRISKKPQLQNGEKQSCSIDNQCVKD